MSASKPAPHRSFLVTCVGAYDDSGLGTGGFVCLQDGAAVVIDKIDSTGLCIHGEVVHRFARGMRAIVGYGPEGLRSFLRVPEARDVHDLFVLGDQFAAVSTGSNEVVWLDLHGSVVRRWQAEGERDAWHLNCLWPDNGRLYLCAFGRFPAHRGWLGHCQETGIVFDLESGREVMGGLSGPHNPRLIDGHWVVCNSHALALLVQAPDGTRRSVALGGFTRGLAFDAHYYYVGVSANRKAAVPETESHIAVVDRDRLEVVGRYAVPFPEIYDLNPIAPGYAARIAGEPGRFQLDLGAAHARALERQVELGLEEIARLNRELAEARGRQGLRGALGDVKRAFTRTR
jgi:hypothetical protein